MLETKVTLTIISRGAQLMSEDECNENPKENYETVKQTFITSSGKNKKKEVITFNTRKTKFIKQVINMNKDAYNFMTSKEKPEWYIAKVKPWDQLSKNERLIEHFKIICEDLRGKRFTFHVFED